MEERFLKCFNINFNKITDTILLELICILNNKINIFDREYYKAKDKEKLKSQILTDCIYNKELIDKEVVKLFEG